MSVYIKNSSYLFQAVLLRRCPPYGLEFSASSQSEFLSKTVLTSDQRLALGYRLWDPFFSTAILSSHMVFRIPLSQP